MKIFWTARTWPSCGRASRWPGGRLHHQPLPDAKEKRPFRRWWRRSAGWSGDVSLEVVATDFDGMVKEGKELVQVAPNVVVKCPLTKTGSRR